MMDPETTYGLPCDFPPAKSDTVKTTKPQRISWMNTTSSIVGSHMKKDMDSYLSLIRRKIQEKCSTTHDLMTQIRRNKVGEGKFVTPHEFRYTLIKFGIIFPQSLVDVVFNVFDSDKSGTMDFDEFAMWIMNAEFKPPMLQRVGSASQTTDEVLRTKFLSCYNQNQIYFNNKLKDRISFFEFMSEMNRLGMKITDREVRSIFVLLDPENTGFVDKGKMLAWVTRTRQTASRGMSSSRSLTSSRSTPNPQTYINKVIGKHWESALYCFHHIPRGQGIYVTFEEFRRLLNERGLGKDYRDTRNLFVALTADSQPRDRLNVDKLFDVIESVKNSAPPVTYTNLDAKDATPSYFSIARAARHLREAIRKNYIEVKEEIMKKDTEMTGYIDATELYNIMLKRTMPISFQDFRYIVQQLKTKDGGSQVNWHSFLSIYNPRRAPHQLMSSQSMGELDFHSGHFTSHLPRSTPLTANQDELTRTLLNSRGTSSGSVRPKPTRPANTNPLSQSTPCVCMSEVKKGTLPVRPQTSSSLLRVSARKEERPSSRANATKTEKQRDMLLTKMMASGVYSESVEEEQSQEEVQMRRMWHTALRLCHRSDPKRSGFVLKNVFVAALETADTEHTLSPETVNKFAHEYLQHGNLIDYLSFFRDFLNQLTLRRPKAASESLNLPELHQHVVRDKGPIHPWQFSYAREKKQEDPYWATANLMVKTEVADPYADVRIPAPTVKQISALTNLEKEAILSGYTAKVLAACSKCFSMFQPQLKALKNELMRSQITSQRGTILTEKFKLILEHYGVTLSKLEWSGVIRAFRGMGLQDVVKYDEFIRVCLLVKTNLHQ